MYSNPSEAIAPNGRYLIQFKVLRGKRKVNSNDPTEELEDNINLDSQRIKKDALYKPLFRKFRAFLRKVFDGLGLSKGCHYWASDRMIKQIMIFANKIKIPPEFKTRKTYAMLAVILFPATVSKMPKDRGYFEELHVYFDEIRETCFEIFRENNI